MQSGGDINTSLRVQTEASTLEDNSPLSDSPIFRPGGETLGR